MQAGNRLDAEGRFTDQPTRDLVAALLTAFKALAGLSLQYSLSDMVQGAGSSIVHLPVRPQAPA